MNLRRPCLLLIAVFAFSARALLATEPTPDELSVYRALFGQARLVVLRAWGGNAEMDPTFLELFASHHHSIVAKNRKRFPTAEPATIESFFTRREIRALFTPKTDIGVRCVVLDDTIYKKLYADMRQHMRNPNVRANGWSAFQRRYPKATAVTYVSRVGFNKDATQALVFLQQTTGPRLDDELRHVILLDRANGNWAITRKEKD